MPHIPNTPESILPRSDSKNPAVTCRGITTNGRPCRRALASSTSSSPASSPTKGARNANAQIPDPSALYCWQHKDQAVSFRMGGTDPAEQNQNQNHRSSMDTLMDRLGILDVNDGQDRSKPKKSNHSARKHRKPRRRTFCCFVIEEEQDSRHPRPARPSATNGHVKEKQSSGSQRAGQTGVTAYPSAPQRKSPIPNLDVRNPQKRNSSRPLSQSRPQSSTLPSPRPGLQRNRNTSQTQSLLSWIPPTLSPQTTSLLLTELAKPLSESDEAGYIYMFWVTPSVPSPPPPDIASSLFPPSHRPPNSRSVSEAIRAADDLNVLTSKPSSANPGTVRLKIGRTSNVQRRLNEWTRQCSHNLTLIRYYPYTSSSSPSPAASPGRSPQGRNRCNGHGMLEAGRKVPHVHRVERLIHIELGDIRVRDIGRCSECNREHREWFEIAAEKNQLRRVEECIRRWVQWGESQGNHTRKN